MGYLYFFYSSLLPIFLVRLSVLIHRSSYTLRIQILFNHLCCKCPLSLWFLFMVSFNERKFLISMSVFLMVLFLCFEKSFPSLISWRYSPLFSEIPYQLNRPLTHCDMTLSNYLCHSVFLICKEQRNLPYISLYDDKCIITCKGVGQCLVHSKHLASVRWLIIITALNLSFIFKSLVHQEFLCDTNFHICKD